MCSDCKNNYHESCDGMNDVSEFGLWNTCDCQNQTHPNRAHIFHGLVGSKMPANLPPNEPGIWGEAFPDLEDDNSDISQLVRMSPTVTVIADLSDVEVKNANGEWTPIVPMPFRSTWGVHVCLCGEVRLGRIRYQEHYAYAHIMNMVPIYA